MEILEKFETYLQKRGKKNNTRALYLSDARRLIQHFSERKLTDISAEEISTYLNELTFARSESTVKRILSSLRGFFRFLTDEGLCESNPLTGLRKTANPGIAAMPGRKKVQTLRDKCIWSLLTATTLTQAEVIRLDICSVCIGMQQLRLSDGRLLPVSDAVIEPMSKYIKFLDYLCVTDENPLFMGRGRERMSRQALSKAYKRMANTQARGASSCQ